MARASGASLRLGHGEDCLKQGPTTIGGSLQDLLEATSRGNQAAFRSLYQATAPKLFGVVLRITRNRPMAEEVLQETFVKIWQNAERFSPEAGQPMAWLSAIARNRAIDRIRSERIERSRTSDDEGALERLVAPGTGDVVLQESLRVCLGQLDEEARNCVVLAYCSGFSREELAEKYRRPVGTIKTLLHRSVRLLKACLESA
jgi:RNA polymerase sigma-70 factor (ECF subfamily)